MKTNNLSKTTNYKRVTEPNVTVRKQNKEHYKQKNKKKWLIVGQALRLERKRLGLTLNQIGKILGTSPSRISNLENGNGVMLANHLIASYKLVLEHEKLKRVGFIPNSKFVEDITLSIIEEITLKLKDEALEL